MLSAPVNAVPEGFEVSNTVTIDDRATNMKFAADARLFIAENGRSPGDHHRQQLTDVVSPVRVEHVSRTAGWSQPMTVVQVIAGTSPT
ncbi:MAG: hypothetical protein ACI89G_002560 [Minisyncoccia bacterium]